jgi:chromosome segregation ATPase
MNNNQEFERKMNFIVEQQAQFASDIQQLQESQARTEQAVAQTTAVVAETTAAVAETAAAVTQSADTVGQVVAVVTRLANVTHAGFSETNAKINALVDAQIRTEENLARFVGRTEENLIRLEANAVRTETNLARTDENLNKLMSTVDRYLSDRNGPRS